MTKRPDFIKAMGGQIPPRMQQILDRVVNILESRAALPLDRTDEIEGLAFGIYQAEILEARGKKVNAYRTGTHVLAGRLKLTQEEYDSL